MYAGPFHPFQVFQAFQSLQPLRASSALRVPPFGPVRVRGSGAHRLRRAIRRQRLAIAAGLALTAAALAASGLSGEEGTAPSVHGPPKERQERAERLVSAPVRIADAATVRLLRPETASM
ncbi:hypothetical protein NKH18_21735 [Streptomyces sp. M10(2022)]